ncbi:MAG: flagellar biosynthesis protein FlhF, partial [Aeromonas sobria]
MKIKRFFAKDMRTALAEVKETLGPDAVIMSNKKVTGGVEIVAAVDYQSQVPGPKDAPVRRQLNDESVNISSAGRQMTRPEPTQAKEQNEHYADTLAALLARQQKLKPGNAAAMSSTQSAGLAAANTAPRTLAEQGQWGAAPEPAKPKARAATLG